MPKEDENIFPSSKALTTISKSPSKHEREREREREVCLETAYLVETENFFVKNVFVGSQIVAHALIEAGNGPNKPNTINL